MQVARPRHRARRTIDDAASAMYERFGFKSWLRDISGKRRGAPDAARRDRAARSSDRRPALGTMPRMRRARGGAAGRHALRNGARRGGARALARSASTRAELAAFDTETTEPRPDAGAHRRHFALGRARARAPTSRSRTATPARRSSSTATRTLARLEALARGSREAKARAEHQVRHARARQPRHRAARRGPRHAAASPTCSRAHQPHDLDTSPSATSAARRSRYDDVRGKGANQIPLRPGRRSSARPSMRPRTRTSRCSCTTRSGRGSRADAKLSFIYAQIEMPVARRAVPHGAQRRADRLRSCSRSRAASSASAMMALEQQAHELAGQPFNLGSPEADRRDPVRAAWICRW